jgi:SpoIID/LytB domain protein
VFCLLVPASGLAQSRSSSAGPAYLILALPSHKVVAQSRPEILATPISPGSVMKLVTLAVAFEQGVAGPDTRLICRRTIDVDGRTLTCVHAEFHRALSPVEALGHSCNAYFATLARRIERPVFDRVLVRLGLGPSDPAVPIATAALGLRGVRVTAPDALEAFCRLAGVSRTETRFTDDTRRVLRLGLETAARTGTASALAEAGFSAFAKTGTAPMPGGGYHGLVTAVVNTELPTHAIVVIAPGTSGANAAVLAAEILARHGAPRRGTPAGPSAGPPEPGFVRAGYARRTTGYDVESIPLEEYVARAVTGEGDDALPDAAREALAITARTWALANRGRHEADGFDQCNLTHCLSLRRATAAARVAAAATAGRVLAANGAPAEVYLSAWCGGHTERPSRVWDGARDSAWLPAQPDPACAKDTPWVSELAEPQVRQIAQAAGLRGTRIEGLFVLSRTSSGRIDRLGVTGMAPDRLAGNVFRAMAGRLLGWNLVKSARFEVRRTATGFRLTGTGLGHGVGLCVRGAAARASGGAGAGAILAVYFPGLTVSTVASAPDVRVLLPEADRAQLPGVRDVAARALAWLAADLGATPPSPIELRFHPTVEAYTRATGLPWWSSGRTRGARIDLLPHDVLRTQGSLERTIRHEIVHVLTDAALADRPLWVREGLARIKAGESAEPGGGASGQTPGRAAPRCPADAELRDAASPDAWRRAYDAAASCVSRQLAAGKSWRDLR